MMFTFDTMARATLLALCVFGPILSHAQSLTQTQLNELAQGLKITWTVVTNTKQEVRYEVEITLENQSPSVSLSYSPSSPWRLYFNTIYNVEPDLLGNWDNKTAIIPGQGVKITHVQGSYFYFSPTENFISLGPGQTRKIKTKVKWWSVSRTDTMPNWYLTSGNLQPAVVTCTQGEDLSFVADRTNVQQWKRYDYDHFNPYLPEDRYERNFVEFATDDTEMRVVPKPAHVTMTSDPAKVKVDSSWTIVAPSDLAEEAGYLKNSDLLKAHNLPVVTSSTGPTQEIRLVVDQIDLTNVQHVIKSSPDAYSLVVDQQSSLVTITGNSASGVFYGIVTLASLTTEEGEIPECTIVDSPRFEYRGVMLDIARNFHTKEDIMELIEVLSRYKVNKLHLHLTDDEAWRIEIPALPELTQLGSRRCHDETELTCLQPELGSGPDSTTPFGTGFLSTNDYIEILRLANKRHVTIIPEVDMPGHARAAIKSMELRYHNQVANGKSEDDAASNLLSELDDPSEYISPQMFTDNAINPCLSSVHTFLKIIINEFVNLHQQGEQPLKLFHFGGDEVGRGAWTKSKSCKDILARGESPKHLIFMNISEIADDLDLALGAWEDGLMASTGNPFDRTDSKVRDVYAYNWDNVWEWGTIKRTYTFANMGYKVVMTHVSHMYFDHPYEPDPEERGFYWGTRFTDTKKTFSYTAERYYDNFLIRRSGEPVTDEEKCGDDGKDCPQLNAPENIIGMECTLFSETTRTREHMHDRYFPRILAFVERAWHAADWEFLPKGQEKETKLHQDWMSFARAVGHRELKRLDKLGVAYRIPPPGAKYQGDQLLTTPLFPGLTVQYSRDSGVTWSDVGPSLAVDDGLGHKVVWLRSRSTDGTRYSRTVTVAPGHHLPVTFQPIVDNIAETLDVKMSLIGGDSFIGQITLNNTGHMDIPTGNWRIYFSSLLLIEPDYLLNGHVYVHSGSRMSIDHVQGQLFSVGPDIGFSGLAPKESVVVEFMFQHQPVSRYEQMPNWYVSAPGMNARNLVSTQNVGLEFVSLHWQQGGETVAGEEAVQAWSLEDRYHRNRAWQVPTSNTNVPSIIPTPAYISVRGGDKINLLEGEWTLVYTQPSLESVANTVQGMFQLFFTEIQLKVEMTAPSDKYIMLISDDFSDNSNASEAYRVKADSSSRTINVTAETSTGSFYGAISLLHMVLKSGEVGTVPDCDIEDGPRYSYRGVHLDVARNFVNKSAVLKLLNVMSLYKLNKFHFHLTDDQGWRLHLPGLDHLVTVGALRCHDPDEKDCVMSTLGSGASFDTSGSGFYTQEDYEEIVQYAALRHIEVIPEVALPGHMHAAITAMDASTRTIKDLNMYDHTTSMELTEENDPSHYMSSQMYKNSVMNPCLDSSKRFVQKVFQEIVELHKDIQPLKTFHFGGDEVSEGAWQQSESCSQALNKGVDIKADFVQGFLSNITHKLQLAAWEEGFTDHRSQFLTRTDFANSDVMAYVWDNKVKSPINQRAVTLANAGYKVVLSHSSYTFFDHAQESNPKEPGLFWDSNYVDTLKTFTFMPDDLGLHLQSDLTGRPLTVENTCTGNNAATCPTLNEPQNIIGIQGQLFTETIRSPDQLEYMAFPRILALAERAWHKGSGEEGPVATRLSKLKSDWSQFSHSLGNNDLSVLDKVGVAYRVPPPGVMQNKEKLVWNVEFPGLSVQYRVQNSPWSTLTSSRTFQAGDEVEVRTLTPDGRRTSSVERLVLGNIGTPSGGDDKDRNGSSMLHYNIFYLMAGFLVCLIGFSWTSYVLL